MNDPSAALQRLGAALGSGDRDAVMACFAADASVHVMSGQKEMTFTSKGIRQAVDALMGGFENIRLTSSTQHVSAARIVQESVLSGDHTGIFAGAQPTSTRIHVNVKLSATASSDSSLQSLVVDADTRALFAQIAETVDSVGVGGSLVATVRERHGGAVRVVSDDKPSAAPAFEAIAKISRSRRSWVTVAGAAALLLMVFLIWRPGSTDPALAAKLDLAARATASSTPTPTVTPSVAPTPSEPAPTPTASATLPVIATAAPRAVPHVQPGRQVVLNSDVLFGFNSSALTPAATAAVTDLAGQLRAAGSTGTIQINGYTDNRGGVAYCLTLSRARALAVARVLQSGLAGQAVTLAPQGFGQANPIAPNTSDANRARNRRVTIVVPTPKP